MFLIYSFISRGWYFSLHIKPDMNPFPYKEDFLQYLVVNVQQSAPPEINVCNLQCTQQTAWKTGLLKLKNNEEKSLTAYALT